MHGTGCRAGPAPSRSRWPSRRRRSRRRSPSTASSAATAWHGPWPVPGRESPSGSPRPAGRSAPSPSAWRVRSTGIGTAFCRPRLRRSDRSRRSEVRARAPASRSPGRTGRSESCSWRIVRAGTPVPRQAGSPTGRWRPCSIPPPLGCSPALRPRWPHRGRASRRPSRHLSGARGGAGLIWACPTRGRGSAGLRRAGPIDRLRTASVRWPVAPARGETPETRRPPRECRGRDSLPEPTGSGPRTSPISPPYRRGAGTRRPRSGAGAPTDQAFRRGPTPRPARCGARRRSGRSGVRRRRTDCRPSSRAARPGPAPSRRPEGRPPQGSADQGESGSGGRRARPRRRVASEGVPRPRRRVT